MRCVPCQPEPHSFHLSNTPTLPPSLPTSIPSHSLPHLLLFLGLLADAVSLQSVAATFKVPFSFNVLPVDLPDLNVDMVKREEGELLLVNCSLRLHNLMDETVTPSNPRAAVLKTMRQLQPALATLVEQHTNHNSPFFLSRFLESLHYYALLFDAMDASVADSEERRLFERRVLGRAIVNVVAAEGQERTERQEPLGHWQRRVQRAGFAAWPLSRDVVATASALLST